MLQLLDREGTRDDATRVESVPVESVGQVAAGGLLVTIAVVELALGFWVAGWQHRAVALSIACVGIAFLLSGFAQIALARRTALSELLPLEPRHESERR